MTRWCGWQFQRQDRTYYEEWAPEGSALDLCLRQQYGDPQQESDGPPYTLYRSAEARDV